jgi:peptidoglycan/LPS O-acetylase OafA/YrhL
MFKVKPRIIIGSSSIFLDALRICAALTVLYIHAFDHWFPKLAHPQSEPGEPSHTAVIVFFVLSGYVIAHTTISKNRGGIQYAQARLSRLCSVVIPVLVMTALIQVALIYIDPVLLATYSRGPSIVRYILSGLFINEIWFFSAGPPINGSLWSLSYEFWYYAIFGFWMFKSNSWRGYILPLAACLIAGPKILLLMPVWLCGYAAYSLPRPPITKFFSWLLVIAGILAAWAAVSNLPSIPYKLYHKPLFFSNQFITDWVTGLFIAFMLWILPTGNEQSIEPEWTALFRKIADLTFPLYVLHFPLLVLWRGMFGFKLNSQLEMWQAIIFAIFISAITGILLERQRELWIRFFKWLLNYKVLKKTNQ